MYSIRRASLILAGLFLNTAAFAGGPTIGTTIEVVRDVRSWADGAFKPLFKGDEVFHDQRIRSEAESSALISLYDKTRIAIGPSSEIVLDDFFLPDSSKTLQVSRGVFRFISGHTASPGTHYIVKTPQASIAVRGTRFDVTVTAARTTVVLYEGAVDVCGKGRCQSMKPGMAMQVTRAGIRTAPSVPAKWTFAPLPGTPQAGVAAVLDVLDPGTATLDEAGSIPGTPGARSSNLESLARKASQGDTSASGRGNEATGTVGTASSAGGQSGSSSGTSGTAGLTGAGRSDTGAVGNTGQQANAGGPSGTRAASTGNQSGSGPAGSQGNGGGNPGNSSGGNAGNGGGHDGHGDGGGHSGNSGGGNAGNGGGNAGNGGGHDGHGNGGGNGRSGGQGRGN